MKFIALPTIMKLMKKFLASNLSKFFFLVLIFFTGCSEYQNKSKITSIEISQDDRIWMDKFFRDLFLEGPALYTLFGTKPMTGFTIAIPSEREWIEAARPHWQNLPEKEKLKVLREMREYCRQYDLHLNWKKWMQWRKNHPSSSFLFAKRSSNQNGLFNIDMINTKETTWTLQKYYELFRRELEMDFDPLDATLDFENPQSVFWEKIFSNHFLLGILYGFGERNAYLFSREIELEKTDKKRFHDHFLFSSRLIKNKAAGGDIRNIKLPAFRSYAPPFEKEDPIIIKYRKEKKQIQNYLKKKQFLDAVLNQLLSPTVSKGDPE